MSQFARRNFLRLAAATAAVSALPRNAAALDYPNHAVRLVIGFPPGGPTDIYGRLIGQWLSQRLGQPFVVENRPGAGSTIGVSEVVHSAPDGYTILLVSTSAAISSIVLSQSRLQPGPRHRAGLRHFARAHGHGRASVGAGQNRSRIHRLCQSQSRQDQHGVGRQRHHAAPGRRIVQDDGRRRSAPCAVSRCRAGADRSIGRPGASDVRGHVDAGRLHQGRQAAGLGGDAAAAFADLSGRAEHRRIFAGL